MVELAVGYFVVFLFWVYMDRRAAEKHRTDEQAAWRQERAELLNRIQAPERLPKIVSGPVRPREPVNPAETEEAEMAKVGLVLLPGGDEG